MYEDGFDAAAATYDEKIAELRKVFNPIANRVEEHRQRPQAIQARLEAAASVLTTVAAVVLTVVVGGSLSYWLAARVGSSLIGGGRKLGLADEEESEAPTDLIAKLKKTKNSFISRIYSVPFFVFLSDLFTLLFVIFKKILIYTFGSVFRLLKHFLGRDGKGKWGSRKGGKRLGGEVAGKQSNLFGR